MAGSVDPGFVCRSLLLGIFISSFTFQVTGTPLPVKEISTNLNANSARISNGIVRERHKLTRRGLFKRSTPRGNDTPGNTRGHTGSDLNQHFLVGNDAKNVEMLQQWEDRSHAGQEGYYMRGKAYSRHAYSGGVLGLPRQGEDVYQGHGGHTDAGHLTAPPRGTHGTDGKTEKAEGNDKYAQLSRLYEEPIRTAQKSNAVETGVYKPERYGVPKRVAGFWWGITGVTQKTPQRQQLLGSLTKTRMRLELEALRSNAHKKLRVEGHGLQGNRRVSESPPSQYPSWEGKPGHATRNHLPNLGTLSSRRVPFEKSSSDGNIDVYDTRHPVNKMLVNLRLAQYAHPTGGGSINNAVGNENLAQDQPASQVPAASDRDSVSFQEKLEGSLNIPMPPKSKIWLINHRRELTSRSMPTTTTQMPNPTTTTRFWLPRPPKSKLWKLQQEELRGMNKEMTAEETEVDGVKETLANLTGNGDEEKNTQVKLFGVEVKKNPAKMLSKIELLEVSMPVSSLPDYVTPYVKPALLERRESWEHIDAAPSEMEHRHSNRKLNASFVSSARGEVGSWNRGELNKVWQDVKVRKTRVKRALAQKRYMRMSAGAKGMKRDTAVRGKALSISINSETGRNGAGGKLGLQEGVAESESVVGIGHKFPLPPKLGNAIVRKPGKRMDATRHIVHADRVGVPRTDPGFRKNAGEGSRPARPGMTVVLNRNARLQGFGDKQAAPQGSLPKQGPDAGSARQPSSVGVARPQPRWEPAVQLAPQAPAQRVQQRRDHQQRDLQKGVQLQRDQQQRFQPQRDQQQRHQPMKGDVVIENPGMVSKTVLHNSPGHAQSSVGGMQSLKAAQLSDTGSEPKVPVRNPDQAVNESMLNTTGFQYGNFNPAAYKNMMRRYRSQDALWAGLCLGAVLFSIFAAVWYSKMWRHRNGTWDLPSQYQPQSAAIPIKELIRQKLGRLTQMKLKRKRKWRGGRHRHGYTQLKASRNTAHLESSSDEAEVIYRRT